jgi:hypothetical protein
MMAQDHVRTPHGSRGGKLATVSTWLKQTLVAGDTAGDHTVTGIAVGDEIISVMHNTAGTLADVTDEFSITDDDTVSNLGGTDTSSDQLLILWADLT